MKTSTCLDGVYFGSSSAIVSAIVLFVTLRPICHYRSELFVALVALALIDSLSDAYALWNSTGGRCGPSLALGTKVVMSGLLALLVARSASPHVVYLVVGLMAIGHFVLSVVRHRWEEALFMFGGAIISSIVLHLLVQRLTQKRP